MGWRRNCSLSRRKTDIPLFVILFYNPFLPWEYYSIHRLSGIALIVVSKSERKIILKKYGRYTILSNGLFLVEKTRYNFKSFKFHTWHCLECISFYFLGMRKKLWNNLLINYYVLATYIFAIRLMPIYICFKITRWFTHTNKYVCAHT